MWRRYLDQNVFIARALTRALVSALVARRAGRGS
jgi:hypothetical protein